MHKIFIFITTFLLITTSIIASEFASIPPASSQEGYLTYLLINENPFPGEAGYVSVNETKQGMAQILWVINNRLNSIPKGYTEFQIANTNSKTVIGVISAKDQCEGFFINGEGKPEMANRIKERVNYLLEIANSGGVPGNFSDLINYAVTISKNYIVNIDIFAPNLYSNIHKIGSIYVTGDGYSWMTDINHYSPGGDYVFIPNNLNGAVGGNRFFTLKKRD